MLIRIFFSVDYSCKTFEDDVQCSKEMKEVATDKSHCGYLNPKTRRSSPFNICLAYKPTLAKQMFESCIFDVCSYFDDVKKRTEAACRAAEGLETICEASGFDVQWRSSAFCRKISVWSKFLSDKSKNKALSDNTFGTKNNHYIWYESIIPHICRKLPVLMIAMFHILSKEQYYLSTIVCFSDKMWS